MNVKDLCKIRDAMKPDLGYIMGYFKLDQPFKAAGTVDNYGRSLYVELSLKKKSQRMRMACNYFRPGDNTFMRFEVLLAKAIEQRKLYKW